MPPGRVSVTAGNSGCKTWGHQPCSHSLLLLLEARGAVRHFSPARFKKREQTRRRQGQGPDDIAALVRSEPLVLRPFQWSSCSTLTGSYRPLVAALGCRRFRRRILAWVA